MNQRIAYSFGISASAKTKGDSKISSSYLILWSVESIFSPSIDVLQQSAKLWIVWTASRTAKADATAWPEYTRRLENQHHRQL